MFSKEILKQDLEYMMHLKSQRNACAKLITEHFQDLIQSEHVTFNELEDGKSVLKSLQDQLFELNNQIVVLEEQMFLNYTNTFCITSSRPTPPGFKFPHISNLDS